MTAPGTPQPPPASPETMRRAMLESPAFRALPANQQDELSQSMARVFDFIERTPEARQMAPDLSQLRSPQGGGSGQSPEGTAAMQPPFGGGGNAATPPPATGGGQSAIERTGAASAALLQAIDFPSFVSSLVQGTFQAIVDASIQQMEAYATLLRESVKDIDNFTNDNVSSDQAKDHLASNYGDIFTRNLSGGTPKLEVLNHGANGAAQPQLPTFLQNLGFDSALDIDQQSLEQVVIPETQRSLGVTRHQTLATMVMMGINRIIVSDGEVAARLIFHVDASEKVGITFSENKPTSWTYAATLGRNPFAANGILVQTSNLNAQQDINIRADLTGEVKIRFQSETFPLERFADTAAIQLINNNAKPLPERPAPGAVPSAGPPTPAATPLPPPPPLPATPPTTSVGLPMQLSAPGRIRSDDWEPAT